MQKKIKARQTLIIIDSSFDEVYRTSVQVTVSQKWKIENSDATAGFFRAKTPSSMRVWEDDVSVSFSENDDDTVTITVDSNLGQRPNRRIVEEYLTDSTFGVGCKTLQFYRIAGQHRVPVIELAE